jgi:hypothetical protein
MRTCRPSCDTMYHVIGTRMTPTFVIPIWVEGNFCHFPYTPTFVTVLPPLTKFVKCPPLLAKARVGTFFVSAFILVTYPTEF